MDEQAKVMEEASKRFGRDDRVFMLYVRKGWEWMLRVREFERERNLLRTDYLLRGICEREVDGLLEDAALYTGSYIHEEARFSYLYHMKSSIGAAVQRAFGVPEILDFSEEQWRLFLLFLQEEC